MIMRTIMERNIHTALITVTEGMNKTVMSVLKENFMRTSFIAAAPVALVSLPAMAHEGDHSHHALAELLAHAFTYSGHLAVVLPLLAVTAWGVSRFLHRRAQARREAE